MRRLTDSLLLFAMMFLVAFVAFVAAGCGRGGEAATGGLTPTPNVPATLSPGLSLSPSLPATATTHPPASSSAGPSAPHSAASPAPTSRSAMTPTPTSSPAATGGPADIWPLVIIGAIAIIAVVVWVFRAEGRRGAAAAAWRSTVIDAYGRGSALHDAMSVAERPAALAGHDAARRWLDIQRRADDFAQMLYALREAAPDENSRGRVTDVLATLQAVRAAMDAERAPGASGDRHAEHVRSRLLSFDAALRALRASDQLMA